MEPYSKENNAEWEKEFIKEIIKYTKKLIENLGPKLRIHIMIDGVVPMAKIRQQRLRRFKSSWTKDGSGWDTNAITPGTEFMEKLCVQLKLEGWDVSGADEPGEGEQKIMSRLRQGTSKLSGRSKKEKDTEKKPIVIYGLDADLIILSLLHTLLHKKQIILMREEKEEGAVPQIGYMSIDELSKELGSDDEEFLLDYIFCMSLMGNDFVPHSMSLTLRDKGHDIFLSMLRTFSKKGRIMKIEEGIISYKKERLVEFIKEIAALEEGLLVKKIKNKFMLRREGEEAAMDRAEQVLLNGSWGLLKNWEKIYYKTWFHVEKEEICKEYFTGLNWIIDYYTGQKEISYDWYYPWNLPPLWRDLASGFYSGSRSNLEERILPQEQLAMVLPLNSWWLIRDPKLKKLPGCLPAFWPKSSGLFTAGRTWMWECVVEIPILSLKRLRNAIREEGKKS